MYNLLSEDKLQSREKYLGLIFRFRKLLLYMWNFVILKHTFWNAL